MLCCFCCCSAIAVMLAAVQGMPLAVTSYFSKNMSRHGKGALALLYFGHKVSCHKEAVRLAGPPSLP
jgi:hypothetical protein